MDKEISHKLKSRKKSTSGSIGEGECNYTKSILGKFENIQVVLENAALTAALMNYAFHNCHEFYSMLYYFTIEKYVRINEPENRMRNYNYINMEIFTVFIHPRSILPIPYENEELFDKIQEHINSPDCIVYFHKMSNCIVTEVLSKYLVQFKELIESGEEVFSYSNRLHDNLVKLNELNILESQHKSLLNSLIRNQKSRCLAFQQHDIKNQNLYDFQVSAVTKALNTQLDHFIFSKRYSCINHMSDIAVPTNTFLSTSPVKLPNKLRVKAHCFEADSLATVSFCLVCDIILWGPYPNCLRCRNCKKGIHNTCKDTVKTCQIDTKKLKKSDSTANAIDKEKEIETTGQMRLDNMVKGLTKIIDDKTSQKESAVDLEDESIAEDIEKDTVLQRPPITKFQELRKQYSSSFFNEKARKSVIKSTSSVKSTKKSDGDTVTRSKSARTPSPEKLFNEDLTRLHLAYPSADSGIATSTEPLPTSQIETDDEMQVTETFQPEIELKRFSKVLNNTGLKHKADDNRLLVLMEFHHNIKFIRMTLKRFIYLLVEPWLRMNEHMRLFDLLSLDCIDKLYRLIGSLVDVIDSCETEATYDSSTAERVLDWLSVDDEGNLFIWLQLCINLCCTNTLQTVKVVWSENKQMYPKLNELFSKEINRLMIVDQLSNMRPLLFNLPMIVNKIIKDLKKFPKFKDEVNVWKTVHEKISRLPKLIDERCMQVIDLINNGTIVPSSLKYKQNKNQDEIFMEIKTYIDHFPNTIFKNNFMDFQFVRLTNLSQSCNREGKMNSVVFVKEELDAAVICYEMEMIFLQKENEKYMLKKFKDISNRKMFPIIRFDNVHLTKQTNRDSKEFRYQLSILVIDQIILAQISFKSEPVRDMWFNMITKTCRKMKSESKTKPEPHYYNKFDCVEVNEEVKVKDCEYVCPKTEMIRARLHESVNQLSTSFDLISNELSTDAIPGGSLKRKMEIRLNKPNEFLLGYFDILKEYMIVGENLIANIRFDENNPFVAESDVGHHTTRLKEITSEMEMLIQTFEQGATSRKSSCEAASTEEAKGHKKSDSGSTRTYIEEIIEAALNKIQYNSKSADSEK